MVLNKVSESLQKLLSESLYCICLLVNQSSGLVKTFRIFENLHEVIFEGLNVVRMISSFFELVLKCLQVHWT